MEYTILTEILMGVLVLFALAVVGIMGYIFHRLNVMNSEIMYLANLNEQQKKPIETINKFIDTLTTKGFFGNDDSGTGKQTEKTKPPKVDYIN